MDTLTIISAIVAVTAFAGLVWMAGYELGQASARNAASQPHRPTVAELINELKPRRSKSAKNRRKVSRKGTSGGGLW